MRYIHNCTNPTRIAAFTGHRTLPWGNNDHHPLCIETKNLLTATILGMITSGKNTFLCGLALGADTMFAQEVLRLRAQGHQIHLVGAIPSEQQTERWQPAERERYYQIREQCAALYVHDPNGTMPIRNAYLGRNDWMVDNSSVLIAYYDGKGRSGTGHTFNYALKQNKPVINLYKG